MKKLFLILTLAISLSASAQAEYTPKNGLRPDTTRPLVQREPLTDSTALFSVRDIQDFDALLQTKFSVRELPVYQELFKWWQDRLAQKVAAHQSPQTTSPQPKPKQK
jgi:hypothetical protein